MKGVCWQAPQAAPRNINWCLSWFSTSSLSFCCWKSVRIKETLSDLLWLIWCPANYLLGCMTSCNLGQMDMRPEEWQFLNMRLTLILRIIRFSFPNTYSALTVCIYFFSFFLCVWKRRHKQSWSRTVRERLHPSSPLCYQCHEVAKTLFYFLQTRPSG